MNVRCSMTTEINRNPNESSHILMYTIKIKCDHMRCQNNHNNNCNNIDNVKIAVIRRQ